MTPVPPGYATVDEYIARAGYICIGTCGLSRSQRLPCLEPSVLLLGCNAVKYCDPILHELKWKKWLQLRATTKLLTFPPLSGTHLYS